MDERDLSQQPLRGGEVIDGFELMERLHQGGMANLWSVRHPDHAGPMLMKVPRIKGGEDPASIVGFEVEQMILPTLKGVHVPRFIARGDFITRPYIVMEHLPGESLRPRLDVAPILIDEVARIGARVATALHDLHRQHVIHLDIKPSNILFRPSGEAVLVDFGLSRHDQLPDLLDEEFNLPMGTGPYMSPEQVQFVRSEPRSDLFALGVMLYHLTTGARPFGAPTSVRGLRERLYKEPVPPMVLRPDCPPWLQEVILRCLEIHADKRHPSAAHLAQDLANPSQVTLTERSRKSRTGGRMQHFKRWLNAVGAEPGERPTVAEQLKRAPIVLAAVDVSGATDELLDLMRETVRRIVLTEQGARLACVSVMKTNRIGMDELTDRDGNSVHVKQLVGLKHWARPLSQALGLADGRLTFHVLEAPDTAGAILDFARRTQVDHVVMGARGNSALRRYLGSVSSEVVAQAECTVTVVRVPGESAAEG
ncbi:serine/threonine protein kinase [Leptothrix cholodnii SP-6]|uniref:Serine/threonine protein kinase n=1 Tax=Leptothrix cholodnii (strain ATCC 51168 / LMG 8142 / SP-6) TaxID=395495 RepID=B1Y2G7_LEPCP|nr:bifunctional serine/threonine-protein kinase/universal stress protein [Leptothrix cholodnii]ACB33183.1 serine/threonine protein kinase [Leptothrix cholodnii SP-6]